MAENNSSDRTVPSAVLPNTAAVIISAENLWNCSKGTEATVPRILLAVWIDKKDECTLIVATFDHLPTSLQAKPIKSGTENSLASLSALPL